MNYWISFVLGDPRYTDIIICSLRMPIQSFIQRNKLRHTWPCGSGNGWIDNRACTICGKSSHVQQRNGSNHVRHSPSLRLHRKKQDHAGCYHGHVDSLLVKAGSGALTLGNPDSAGIPPVWPINHRIALQRYWIRKKCICSYGGRDCCHYCRTLFRQCGLSYPEDYLEGLRKVCTEYGAVLIFDEVMTGFRLAGG